MNEILHFRSSTCLLNTISRPQGGQGRTLQTAIDYTGICSQSNLLDILSMMKHIFLKCRHIILFKTFQQLLPTRLASNTMLFSFSKVLSLHKQPGFPQTFKIRLVSITMCPFPNTPHVTCLMCPPH